jgi:small subunit ribosomal protein S21
MTERIVVKVDGGNIEKALRQWKRKFITQKVVEELRERTEYVKPSVKRRTQIKDAVYRQKKRTQSEKDK